MSTGHLSAVASSPVVGRESSLGLGRRSNQDDNRDDQTASVTHSLNETGHTVTAAERFWRIAGSLPPERVPAMAIKNAV